VPKRMDQDQRRRAIAEAVFAVIGDRGFGAVSLRDVASAAGVPMGSVQHYFATKDEMLAFEPSRQEAQVSMAFFSAATVTRTYADLLRDAFARLLDITREQLREAATGGQIVPGADPDREAAALFFTARGLIGPVLIGLYAPEDALALPDHQLDRIFVN
jgi:AcrR family transcriptional regulator